MAYTSADLALVETAIRNRISGTPVDRKKVGELELHLTPLADLQQLRSEMLRELAQSEENGGAFGFQYLVPGRTR